MRFSAIAATAGALVLALALAGCGGSGGGSAAKPTNAIEVAALKTSQAGSVRADFTISASGVSGTGSGVFNGGGKRSGQFTMNVNSGGKQISIDSVIDGNTIYLRSPLISQRLPGGKQWVKIDLEKAAKAANVNLNGLIGTNPSPGGALAYLQGSTAIKRVGSETVDGSPTTHYRVVVDLQQAVNRASGSDKDALEQAIKGSGSSTQPVDVWVDAEGYVRKLEVQSQASGQPADLTMKMHDFGSPVPITPPATNEVVDLLQALGGGS
ncbi:MAG TPA: hypothetical protein VEG40_04690 [Gaiellaceae bacterium]|nr:hypothetical protein [Gaiellaceae bacterium]